MMFGFKTSRVFDKVKRWREHKPILQRKLWAVRGMQHLRTIYHTSRADSLGGAQQKIGLPVTLPPPPPFYSCLVSCSFAAATVLFTLKFCRFHFFSLSLPSAMPVCAVIEKHYLLHKSQEFSKRRAEALFVLALVFSKCIRNWRVRRMKRKVWTFALGSATASSACAVIRHYS